MGVLNKRRAILFGIDGATFDLLLPWSRNGIMPNLGRALERGSFGELASTIPPTTPPAWSTCVTGKHPGKHGIYDFRESFHLDPARPLVSLASIRAAKIWQVLNAAGRKTGVMNVPITYPPEEVDGFMISGMMTPSEDSPYTYPTDLKREILRKCGDYVVNIDIPKYDVELFDDAMRFFRDITYCFEKRRETFFYLMDEKEWDFFMVVFIIADRIQHLFWKFLFPGSGFYNVSHAPAIREEIFKCYAKLDGVIGEILARLDGTTDLFIMSDHGFGYTEKWFNVNKWLADLGLLSLRGPESVRKSLFYTAMALNDSKLVKRVVPHRIQSAVRDRIRKGRGTLKTDIDVTLDWGRTRAFFASIPTQGIFINTKSARGGGIVAAGAEYENLRTRLRDELLDLRDPVTGRALIDKVLFREEAYQGPYTDLAPDLLFVAKDYAVLGRQLFGARRWISTSENQANGFHRTNGILISLGRHIKRGHSIEGASIADVMPTVLYAMGESVPDDLDGRVIGQIFDNDFLEANPLRYETASKLAAARAQTVFSEEDSETVRARLAGLGYLE